MKEFLIKCSTSWPYLISEFLVAYITIVASDWPRTFFTPKVFLFSIVVTAAKIVRAAIREKEYNVKSYPTNEDIKNMDQGINWVPQCLRTFLKMLGLPELKQNCIGQSIIQAAWPRSVITPLFFVLDIEMDHVFRSKWLINKLARLGFPLPMMKWSDTNNLLFRAKPLKTC